MGGVLAARLRRQETMPKETAVRMEDKRTANQNAEPVPIPKLRTDIEGLDDVLRGGIPEGAISLIEGGPGAGKTVLGVEVLYHSARAGIPGILVTFEETDHAIRRNAQSMGWDLDALEKEGKLFLFHAPVDYRAIRAGDFDIQPLLAIIKGRAQEMHARLLMIDSIDVLLRIFNDPSREANEVFKLNDWLKEHGFTTILTLKRYTSEIVQKHEFIGFLADCILRLDLRVTSQVTTRRLRVVKYRGSNFGSNEYPYVITEGGSTFLPISRISLDRQVSKTKVSTGNPELDQLLDGGYQSCTSILLTGPSGVGKTTLACTFIQGITEKGARVLYINYEESAQAIVGAMKSPGLDLEPAIASGCLEFITPMPEQEGVEQHLLNTFEAIRHYKPEFLVVDAISSTLRMGGAEAAFTFMLRVIDYCRKNCITCLMTNQLNRSKGYGDLSGIGISSIVETIILVDYVRIKSEIVRSLLILKSRGTRHSMKYHHYQITDNGIRIGEPLDIGASAPAWPQTDPTSDAGWSARKGGQNGT